MSKQNGTAQPLQDGPEKALLWRKQTLGGAIHHLTWAVKALQEQDNPSRIAVAEKHLWFAQYDLGMFA